MKCSVETNHDGATERVRAERSDSDVMRRGLLMLVPEGRKFSWFNSWRSIMSDKFIALD